MGIHRGPGVPPPGLHCPGHRPLPEGRSPPPPAATPAAPAAPALARRLRGEHSEAALR